MGTTSSSEVQKTKDAAEKNDQIAEQKKLINQTNDIIKEHGEYPPVDVLITEYRRRQTLHHDYFGLVVFYNNRWMERDDYEHLRKVHLDGQQKIKNLKKTIESQKSMANSLSTRQAKLKKQQEQLLETQKELSSKAKKLSNDMQKSTTATFHELVKKDPKIENPESDSDSDS